jgi:hypothetical protein
VLGSRRHPGTRSRRISFSPAAFDALPTASVPLNGRVYFVTLRVKDASGNSTTRSVKLIVPVTDVTGPAVDDGVMNTVASACR